MNFVLGAIKIIFVLGLLIFIHEGGHFVAAFFSKVKVKEFSIGFGPKIFSKQFKTTKFSLRLIPFGGFVDMLGENERKDEVGSFSNAKIWKRILIVSAGAIVNICFAIIIYFSLIAITGNNISTQIDEILPEYSENLAELKSEDKIISIDGKKVYLKSDIGEILNELCKDEVVLGIERNNNKINVKVKTSKQVQNILGIAFEEENNIIGYIEPKSSADKVGLKVGDEILEVNEKQTRTATEVIEEVSENKNIKIKINRQGEILEIEANATQVEYYYLGIKNKLADSNFKNNVYYAYWETIKFVEGIFENLIDLFTGNIYIEQMSGPIGISEYIVKTDTMYNYIYLMSLISLSLGITNLLPIPALDGGKLFLLIIEWIRKKPIKEELEIKIQTFGFLILMSLAIYISFNDILKLF